MTVSPYWRMVLRKVCAATASHWRNKIVWGMVLGMLALIIQYKFQLRSLGDTGKIAVSLAGSAVIVLAGSFIRNLIVIPAAIYPEPKDRTAAEAEAYATAEAALQKLGSNARIILRHLRRHGRLKFNHIAPPLPDGMSPSVARRSLEGCVSEQLATRESVQRFDGNHDYIYTISRVMEPVLDDLLYQSTDKE